MKISKYIVVHGLILTLLIATLNSCNNSKVTSDDDSNPIQKYEITLNLTSFVNGADTGKPNIEELDLFIFNKGVLRNISTHSLTDDKKITIELLDAIESKFFLLSDPNNMTDYSHLVEGQSLESDFIEVQTKDLNPNNGDVVAPFYTGVKDMKSRTDSDMNSDINIDMIRGIARLDITIEPNSNIIVNRIKLVNVNKKSFVYKHTATATSEKGDFEKIFSPALTNSANEVFYLLEQQSKESYAEINVTISGVSSTLKAILPPVIERNKIYNIKISGEGAYLQVSITERDWEIGEDIEARPDFVLSKIDVEQSDMPKYVSVSKTLDTLFIPSCDTKFKIAISTNSDIEVVTEGNLTIMPNVSSDTHVNTVFDI